MIDPMEDYRDLEHEIMMLDKSVKQLRTSGTKYAEAERDYKIKLRQEALKMREDGMAVSLVGLTIYGVQSVAQARYDRDVAEAVYKANMEAINAAKLKIRILDARIEREWGRGDS